MFLLVPKVILILIKLNGWARPELVNKVASWGQLKLWIIFVVINIWYKAGIID